MTYKYRKNRKNNKSNKNQDLEKKEAKKDPEMSANIAKVTRILNKCVTKMTKLFPSHSALFFRVSI